VLWLATSCVPRHYRRRWSYRMCRSRQEAVLRVATAAAARWTNARRAAVLLALLGCSPFATGGTHRNVRVIKMGICGWRFEAREYAQVDSAALPDR
jgi:hypothetical protein